MNQNPEQKARDLIDKRLTTCRWILQNKSFINLHAGNGIAVCEYSAGINLELESCLSVEDKLEETITNNLQQAEPLKQSILKEDSFKIKITICRYLERVQETITIKQRQEAFI